ncbi:MAG: MFS transporter [Chloroflexota bacterium]
MADAPAARVPPGSESARADGLAFAALRNGSFRWYLVGTSTWMLGDNIEHVISYWQLYQQFQSPMLGGYAVISHWLPFLVLSVWAGHLADRGDCRKLIVISQVLFMAVSLAWAYLFLTDTLEVWHAVVLLAVHGFAGVIQLPANQLVIHDIVGSTRLLSAVRTASLGRSLGIVLGPAIGGGLLVLLGPGWGMVANALIYLPMLIWALGTPYTGHVHAKGGAPPARRAGILALLKSLRGAGGNPTILSMVVLAGATSFFVGNAFQAQMPEFADDLGSDKHGAGYSILLAAGAIGGFVGGILLETMGVLRPRARTAIICACLWCLVIIGFAVSATYPLALVFLFVGGFLNLAVTSMAQTLVQLEAPPNLRGAMIGLLSASQSGLRVGSGITVGALGGFIGIHSSLVASAGVLLVITVGLLIYAERGRRAPVTP